MKSKKAFTLIELMIVVAIIGVLASVAIPSFLRFIRQSKYSEAPINMRAIVNGAIAWFAESHSDTNGNPMVKHFPHSSSPTDFAPIFPSMDMTFAPSPTPCSGSTGAKYVKNSNNWNSQPWLALKFSIAKAHYFQYMTMSWLGSGGVQPQFQLAAMTDIDCDGNMITYRQATQMFPSSEEDLISFTQIFVSGDD